MPDDNRFDLSEDLSKVKSDFLEGVEAAAEEVKQQLEVAAENERKKAEVARSKKFMAALATVGAIAVLLLSYWLVFARPDTGNTAVKRPSVSASEKLRIASPTPVRKSSPTITNPPAASSRPSRDSQVVEHPSDEYEQPSEGSGM